MGQWSSNDDHHTFIYLQLKNYNSILRTKHGSVWMPPAVYRDVQWLKSDMYKKYERWLCHKYDVNYVIMQSNMTMMMHVMKTEWWKLHGNISRNGYGNAIIGRYGCCFEEDIIRLMCDRAYHITGFGCTGEVCTNCRCEKGQFTVPKRLVNCGRVRVRIIHGLTLVIKNSHTYCKSLLSPRSKVLLRMPLGGRLVGVNHRAPPTFTQR